jgi:hypothetical protein
MDTTNESVFAPCIPTTTNSAKTAERSRLISRLFHFQLQNSACYGIICLSVYISINESINESINRLRNALILSAIRACLLGVRDSLGGNT